MLDPNRLTRVAVTVLLGLLLACCFLWSSDTLGESQLKRGDFPGFYGPAVAVHRGLGASLYDLDTQRELQNEAWPSFKGQFYIYAYPPFLAPMLRPLALLSPIQAKMVATVLLLFSMVAALFVAKPFVRVFRQHRLFTLTICLLFPPMLSGVFAAQNTAVSLLLFIVAFRLLMERSESSDIFAGVALGLWLFKPQYPILLLLLLGLSGRWRVLCGAGIPALLYYVIGSSVVGWDWPITWPQIASEFSSWNTIGNRAQIVSIHGLVVSIGELWFEGSSIWRLFGVGLSTLTFLGFAWCFVKQLRQGTLAKQEDALFLSVPVILLVSPQTLFYDLGIAVVALARIIPALNFRYLVRVALAFILFVVVALLRSEIEFPVYCLISVGIPCLLAFMNEIAVDKTTEAVDE